MGQEIASQVNGDLVVCAGAGHLPNLETPEVFNAAVRAFLLGFAE
jgi:pimeloyl-ACP methyl ester carboxylesterase